MAFPDVLGVSFSNGSSQLPFHFFIQSLYFFGYLKKFVVLQIILGVTLVGSIDLTNRWVEACALLYRICHCFFDGEHFELWRLFVWGLWGVDWPLLVSKGWGSLMESHLRMDLRWRVWHLLLHDAALRISLVPKSILKSEFKPSLQVVVNLMRFLQLFKLVYVLLHYLIYLILLLLDKVVLSHCFNFVEALDML